MNLLIDIGNSRIKWAWSDGGELLSPGQAAYEESVSEILPGITQDNPEISAIRVSNVAGEAIAASLREWATGLGVTPHFLRADREAHGVRNAYVEAQTLGVDRWAALIAVAGRGGQPACIVDSGTATTIDALSAAGKHLGGLILPGLRMMRAMLQQETHGIRSSEGQAASLFARDTGRGVEVGTLYALVSTIDRIACDVQNELGGGVRLVLTGGDAETLLPLLADDWQYHPDLVLEGLAAWGEPQT